MADPIAWPCQYCKGKGRWIEPVLDDGSGPEEFCGVCSGEGWITEGSKEHRTMLHNAMREWMWKRFVKGGDDWMALDEWQFTTNAALNLASMCIDIMLDAKMERYYGDNSPSSVPRSRDDLAPIMAAEKRAEEWQQKHRSLYEKLLRLRDANGSPHDCEGWCIGMDECYGLDYHQKFLERRAKRGS